jgi:HAD superfamily hydrolase (TIGR01509 family)
LIEAPKPLSEGLDLDLVIFDCDGVLVDSEPISNRILAELLSEQGLPTTLEDSYRIYRGRTYSACVAIAEQRLGRKLPEDFLERFNTRLYAACDRELQPIAGVAAAIERIVCAGLRVCVASSGSLEKMDRTLALTDLRRHFGANVYSATEVARSKPHPDIFLHAAGRMGAAPERCCVVEDSPLGVEAGRAAGMPVLGFADGGEGAILEEAGARVFRTMDELPGLVSQFRPPA